jgi:hypothetical protein
MDALGVDVTDSENSKNEIYVSYKTRLTHIK